MGGLVIPVSEPERSRHPFPLFPGPGKESPRPKLLLKVTVVLKEIFPPFPNFPTTSAALDENSRLRRRLASLPPRKWWNINSLYFLRLYPVIPDPTTMPLAPYPG